jgi:hypothetical protein
MPAAARRRGINADSATGAAISRPASASLLPLHHASGELMSCQIDQCKSLIQDCMPFCLATTVLQELLYFCESAMMLLLP